MVRCSVACAEAWNKNPYAPNAVSRAMKAMLSKIARGSGFTMLVSLSTCPTRPAWDYLLRFNLARLVLGLCSGELKS